MTDLPIRLRRLREFVRCTQENLAYELDMTQSAYHKLETGKTQLDLHRAIQLAMFYTITIDDLLYKDLFELYTHLLASTRFKELNAAVSNK